MLKSKGFSLVETMIVLSIATLVSLGFFSVMQQTHRWSSDLMLNMEQDSNVWLSPLLLARWITPAGNHRWGQQWPGLVIRTDQIEITSDIDGAGGFPDAELSSTFESLAIRCSEEALQIKSGGGTFQPLLRNIVAVEAQRQGSALLSLHLTSSPDRTGHRPSLRSAETTRLLFFLRNYRVNLFAEVSG